MLVQLTIVCFGCLTAFGFLVMKTSYFPNAKEAIYAIYSVGKEMQYRLWLFSKMEKYTSDAHKAMEKFLQKKYETDFIVEPVKISKSRFGARYIANAYSRSDPNIKFSIKSIEYSYSKKDFQPRGKLDFFYEGFYSANWRYCSTKLEKQIEDCYQLKVGYYGESFLVGLSYIQGSNKLLETFNFSKIRSDRDKTRKFSDYIVFIMFFSKEKPNLKNEAKKLAKILNKHFSSVKTERYIIVTRYFTAKGREDIYQKDVKSNYNISLFNMLKWEYQKGYLNNASVLFNFEGPLKQLNEEQVLESFLF